MTAPKCPWGTHDWQPFPVTAFRPLLECTHCHAIRPKAVVRHEQVRQHLVTAGLVAAALILAAAFMWAGEHVNLIR